MISFKAYVLSWLLYLTRKGVFSTPAGLHKQIAKNRKDADHRPPANLRTQLIIEERKVADASGLHSFTVYEAAPKSETPNRARVLYLHGGAFVFELSPPHWKMVAFLAERLQASVVMPVYPLGPDFKMVDMYAFLQPLHDELAAAAAADGVPFFVVGDSAGGTMTLVLTQQALKAGSPAATRIVPISPSVDATLNNPDLHTTARRDPWLDVPGCDEAMRITTGDWARDDPRVSPTFGELGNLPPMLVFAGSEDMLTPDTKLFIDKARGKGREIEFVEGKGLMHVWPLLEIAEGRADRERIVNWLGEAL